MPAFPQPSAPHRRWITLCIALVFGMVMIGGLTRLTESGLSIVEWKLVSGTLPPLTGVAWAKEFAQYKQSPQYRQVTHGMDLAGFQRIFWLEYLHRLLGRIVGMVFLLPLAWFALRRTAPGWLLRRMSAASLLVAAQGTAGWLMVSSGLKNVPWVSPYMLALHLLLAVSLLGVLIATRMRLVAPAGRRTPMLSSTLQLHAKLTVAALAIQLGLGALVAGLRAGMTYNTFPLMDGDLIPRGFWQLRPAWRNLTENIPAVQFLHRWWAFAVAGLVFTLAARVWHATENARLRRLALGSAMTVVIQIGLGISTLLLAVPVGLGALHQAVAILLFGWLFALAYAMSQGRNSAHLTLIETAGSSERGLDMRVTG